MANKYMKRHSVSLGEMQVTTVVRALHSHSKVFGRMWRN